MTPSPETLELPRGRLLYARADHEPFVVIRHDRSGALHLAPHGWDDRSFTAGPFDAADVLRALRLANVRVPDGCERGPWQWGIALFDPRALAHPDAWSPFAIAWCLPSVSLYASEDIDAVVNERCCAPPRDEPHVSWREPVAMDVEGLRTIARTRSPEAASGAVGFLEREWNAHPAGSAVLAARPGLSHRFAVVDLPPPPAGAA